MRRKKACGQGYAISGSGGVEPQYTAEDDWEYVDSFSPSSIHPTLPIIDIPPNSPRGVKMELREAFALYWASPEACAARIRVCLEHLLTHVGIPKEKIDTSSGKATEQNLHFRIETYATSEPQLGANLMALKWLGNTASHQGRITRNDVLDAFEVLEHVLSEIIQGNSKRIAELAKKLGENTVKRNKHSDIHALGPQSPTRQIPLFN